MYKLILLTILFVAQLWAQQANTPEATLATFDSVNTNSYNLGIPGPHVHQLLPGIGLMGIQMNGRGNQFFRVIAIVNDPTPGFISVPALGHIDIDFVNNVPFTLIEQITPGLPSVYGGFGTYLPYSNFPPFSVTIQGIITDPQAPGGVAISAATNLRYQM